MVVGCHGNTFPCFTLKHQYFDYFLGSWGLARNPTPYSVWLVRQSHFKRMIFLQNILWGCCSKFALHYFPLTRHESFFRSLLSFPSQFDFPLNSPSNRSSVRGSSIEAESLHSSGFPSRRFPSQSESSSSETKPPPHAEGNGPTNHDYLPTAPPSEEARHGTSHS